MIDRDHLDPVERAELTEQELAIAALVGRYVERREHHETPCVHDLLTAAAEFGDAAVDVLRTVIACYEAMRADVESTRPSTRDLEGDRPNGATRPRPAPG